MARPSDISTKVVSFRIPMKDYIKLLSQATDKGLSISDYMLMRVYQPDGELGSLKEPAKAQTPALPTNAPASAEEPPEKALKQPSKPRSQKKATNTSKAVKKPQRPPEKPAEPKTKAKPVQATKNPPKPRKKREMSADQKAALAKGREKARKQNKINAIEEQLAKMVKDMILEYHSHSGRPSMLKEGKDQAMKALGKIYGLNASLVEQGWKGNIDQFIKKTADQVIPDKNMHGKAIGGVVLEQIKK